MDCSVPASSVHGISQARILEWLPFPSPGDLAHAGIKPGSPTLQADSLPILLANHFSILAWRIPRTEEPGNLQSLGSQRVGHDWATNTFTWKKGLCQSEKHDHDQYAEGLPVFSASLWVDETAQFEMREERSSEHRDPALALPLCRVGLGFTLGPAGEASLSRTWTRLFPTHSEIPGFILGFPRNTLCRWFPPRSPQHSQELETHFTRSHEASSPSSPGKNTGVGCHTGSQPRWDPPGTCVP